YGAILSLTNPFISSASAGDADDGSFRTTNACGLTRRSLSSRPTTATSRTAACLISVASTSIGETQMPPTFSMSSARPAYQKYPSGSCEYLSPVWIQEPNSVSFVLSCLFQ